MNFLQMLKILLRRFNSHRTNTVIMFAGLVISFTFMTVITQYVRNELSYDNFWRGKENIYRLQATVTEPGRPAVEHARSPVPLLDLVQKNFDEVEAGTRIWQSDVVFRVNSTPFRETISTVDPGFFDIFDLQMVEGERTSILDDKRAVILSETTAARLFGADPAVGQVYTVKRMGVEETQDYHVVGVFKDLPKNTHLQISSLALLDDSDHREQFLTNWNSAALYTYVRLQVGTGPFGIEAKLPELEKAVIPFFGSQDVAENIVINLHAIERLHLFQNGTQDFTLPGSLKTVSVYALSGILLVLIAGTNFVNTMIVQAHFRIKEVALRQIYGAQMRGVFAQFLPETFAVALSAFYLSVIGLEFWSETLFELIGYQGETSRADLLVSGSIVFGFAMLLALFAGVYPALKLARTLPLESLRTRNASLALSMKFSKWMMSFQFVIAMVIAIVGSTIWMQISYINGKDLGFDPSGVFVLFTVPDDTTQANEMFDRFSKLPGVVGATKSMSVPTSVGVAAPLAGFSTMGSTGSAEFLLPVQSVDSHFFNFYNSSLLAGRALSRDYAGDDFNDEWPEVNIMLNDAALRLMRLGAPEDAVGKQLWWGSKEEPQYLNIVGIIEDANHTSLRADAEPMLYLSKESFFWTFSFKVAAGQEQTVQQTMSTIWADAVPNQVFEGEFLEDRLRTQYAPEYQLLKFLMVSGTLSIIISCLGLYAISSFLLTRQQKEFAIRKVLGASFSQTSRLAIMRAVKPAIIAALFACPIAYLYLTDWLESFAYRIDMPYEAYVFSSIGMVLVAVLSVYMVAYKVTRTSMAELLAEE